MIRFFSSEEKSYDILRFYRYPFEIEKYENQLVLHSKNNKNTITLSKYHS